ncbi:MAG TPA: phenylalanine--tRNA ligase subunit beta [Syntrophales bacterium]|nr:phenylalanine--tRNA ligase subunit beta [Syntrophales bacterium]
MLVSLRWLKDYVDVRISLTELVDRLTMAGLEVDAVKETGPSFTNVVVAKILSVKPHPSANNCLLCEVSMGESSLPVVCGASNIHTGDVVPLAKIGATLPGGYTIRSSKIRGEISEGMLCSEQELGVGSDEAGIMILPGDLTIGEDLSKALDLNDTVLDIAITPNRSDCLSIIGIAREIAAITGMKFKYPGINVIETEEDIDRVTSVTILDPDLCPRYSARMVKNVTIKTSPLWMRQRLEAVGLRAINNIVDITNYVMIELGQPLHAFDFRFLEEGRIVVRKSRKGEKFTSLDEKERILETDTLMICDGIKPVAIAGIMGGLNSEVKEDTKTILLESAYFAPSSIRKSAKLLGMITDAAFRFGRGVDPEGVVRALNRAAQFMAELSNGSVCKGYIDQYPKKVETARDIPFRIRRANDILGTNISAHESNRILGCLDMSIHKESEEIYRVTPPTYRIDIMREIDLIEELARLHGYDNIPVTLPPVSVLTIVKDNKRILTDRIRKILGGSGYSEIITYSFISSDLIDQLGLSSEDERRKTVKIRNPLSEDQSVMRSTLLCSLLETMKKNANNGCFDLKIFEIGRVFFHQQEGELPIEKNMIGCLITGLRSDDFWSSKLHADFYEIKGCIENIFDSLKISGLKFKSDYREAFLHSGKSSGVFVDDKLLGFLGEVHPDVLMRMDLKNPAYVFEINLDILADYFSDKVLYKDLPRFPSVVRDVAFVVDQGMETDKMLNLAMDMDKELLEKVSIFDVYSGKSVPHGKKSLGLRFTYRASDRTLTDDQVNQVHSGIVKNIVGLTGAKIRGEEN